MLMAVLVHALVLDVDTVPRTLSDVSMTEGEVVDVPDDLAFPVDCRRSVYITCMCGVAGTPHASASESEVMSECEEMDVEHAMR